MGAYGLAVAAAFAVALAVLVSVSTTSTVEAGIPGDAVVHVGDIIDVTATANAAGGEVTFELDDASAVEGVFVHSQTGTLTCAADDNTANLADSTDPVVDTDCDTGGDTTTVGDTAVVSVKFMVTKVTGDTASTGPTVNVTGATAATASFVPSGASYYNHSHSVNGNAGGSVTVTFDLSTRGAHNDDSGTGDGDFYRISDSSVGSGTFAANGQTSLDCADSTTGTGCDTNKAEDMVGLGIAIADDSARGKIIVERYQRVRGGPAVFRDAIEINVVSVAAPVATLKLAADKQSIPAAGTEGSGAMLTVTMQNGDGTEASGQSVTLIATRGVFGNGQQLETVTTNANGQATATFRGARVGGVATVTATSGDLTKSVTITLHSGPGAIDIAIEDATIQAAGASTFIVVTVTDGDGNSVGEQTPSVASVKGPNDLSTQVVTDGTVAKDVAGTANDIPACADGTNKDGKCVIQVSAPTGATAGTHTVNVTLARLPKAALKAAPTVEVVGKPDSLTIAAPETVESRGEADITVTVYDEAGNLAARNEVSVRKIEGQGLIEPMTKNTKNGVAAFKFFAPTSGSVVISVSVGSGSSLVREFHTIAIGDAMEEPEEPAMPSGDGSLSGSIGLAVFGGGSLDDLEAAALAHCPGGAAIYVNDGSGGQILFTAGAAVSIVNNAVAAIYPDGLGANTAVLIARCEADAMENEG